MNEGDRLGRRSGKRRMMEGKEDKENGRGEKNVRERGMRGRLGRKNINKVM